mgnify:CR=1 FL=1
MMRDNEYAPLYEKYVLNPKPDADSDKGGNRIEQKRINHKPSESIITIPGRGTKSQEHGR